MKLFQIDGVSVILSQFSNREQRVIPVTTEE